MNVRKLPLVTCILLLLVVTFSCASRITSISSSPVKSLVEGQNYKFKAEFATPLGGRQIYVTGPYEMVVTRESVTSNLPYYGVAYRAPIGVDEAGIKFDSKDFNYSVRDGKNGWTIQIKPEDTQEVRALTLRISNSGSASLQVTSNYRQSISYSGRILAPTDKNW